MTKRNLVNASATRDEILAKARELFATKGYANTSSREISAAAGVTIGAMFHHFTSKLHLFECVFESFEKEMDAQAKAASRSTHGLGPLETFLAGVRTALDFSSNPDFNRIVFVEGPSVLGEEKWRAIDARLGLKTVMVGVRALMEAGVITEQPVKPIAVLLMGAMNAAGFAIARGEEDVDKEGLIQAMRLLLTTAKPQ